MFDSSKQPDPESTIDFLHNETSSGVRLPKSKKSEPIEYVQTDTTQVPRDAVRSSGVKSVAQNLLGRVKGLFHKVLPATRRATSSTESLLHATHVPESQAVSGADAEAGKRDPASPLSGRDVRSDFHLSQSQPAQSEEKTKGRPIEKIPLNKFHDPEHSEETKHVRNHSDRSDGKGTLKGISFQKDRDGTESEMDVNLLPEQRRSLSPRVKRSVVIALLSFEFIGLLVGFLALQAKADGRMLGFRELESQQTLLDIQVKRYKEVVKEASYLQQRAVMLREILEHRPDILDMVAWLESNTVDTVYYEALSISDKGSVHVRAVALTTEDAAYQMNIFSSTKSWGRVDISSIALERGQSGSFQASFDVQFFDFLGTQEQSL